MFAMKQYDIGGISLVLYLQNILRKKNYLNLFHRFKWIFDPYGSEKNNFKLINSNNYKAAYLSFKDKIGFSKKL